MSAVPNINPFTTAAQPAPQNRTSPDVPFLVKS